MKEVAVYGGTFDPPTRAHEAITQACLELPDIDEVWLMPSGYREDKPGMQPDEVRMCMLGLIKQAVFADTPRLVVTDFEQRLPQPTLTCRTVAALRASHPDTNFWFVFGADSYSDMPNWERGLELQKNLGMLLVARAGYDMPKVGANVRQLRLPQAEIMQASSSEVRGLIEAGDQAAHLVHPLVQKLIDRQQLYQRGTIAANGIY